MRLLLLLLVPSIAAAQVNATLHADPSRGATLLPVSTAWADQATALSYNPAGLNKVGTFELLWAHERSVPRDEVIDGLYFATSPISSLGLGLSVEWLRNGAGTSASRKTSAGIAFGGETVSLGLAGNFFAGRGIDGLTSVDLGIQSRPGRNFSAGLTVKNVDAPARGTILLPRTWDLGVGLRPLGERLSIGVDWVFVDSAPLDVSRLAYSVKAEVWNGLHLHAAVSHAFRPGEGIFFQGGVTVDTQHFGASYALSAAPQGFGHLTTARLSVDKYRRLPIGAGKIPVISLNNIGEASSGSTVATLLNLSAPDRYLKVLRMLEGAATDPTVRGVVLKVEVSGVRLARAQELREAVVRLRAAGKVVVALILSAEDPEYLIASAATHLYAVPEAMLVVDGLRSSVIFLGGTAQKLGVTIDVAKVGAYKNSPDQFTRTSMSDEQREAVNALLDTQVNTLEALVPASRSLTVEQWRASIDEGLKSVKRAKELKLIDDVVSAQQLEQQLPELIPGGRLVADYEPRDERTGRWGTPAHVAVISVLGNITGGGDGSNPVLGQSAGADPFIRNLGAAARDPDVAAIVLRIDSPGGDGLASDMMYRAVLQAKERKPVIASMGDIAASGGYYVAMGANQIFASPTTVTGSIGVFYLKPAVKGLGEQLGAHQEAVNRGKLAGALDSWEPWDDERRASVQKWIDDFYETFIGEVAVNRKTTRDAIDLVARGRVWSGEDAKARGLVDALGGLTEAIAAASQRAGYEAGQLPVVLYGPGGGVLSSIVGDGALARTLREARLEAATPISSQVQRLASQLGADLLVGAPGIQARLEYQLDIR